MTRPNPFRGFVDLMTELERARRVGMTGQDGARTAHSGEAAAEAWTPAADIYSVGDDLIIRLDVPGVPGSDIEVTLADGVLTVGGSRAVRPPAGAKVYVEERQSGPFRRHMILPLTVEQDDVRAVVDDGVVEITVSGAGSTVAAPDRIPVADRSQSVVLRGRESGSRTRGET